MNRAHRPVAVLCLALVVFAAIAPGVLSAIGAVALVPLFTFEPAALVAFSRVPATPDPAERLVALVETQLSRPPPASPLVHVD